MNFEDSREVVASYNDSSTYYNVTNIHNTFTHSFNTTDSHNGHGRAGGCGLIGALLLVAIPVVGTVVCCQVLAGLLT